MYKSITAMSASSAAFFKCRDGSAEAAMEAAIAVIDVIHGSNHSFVTEQVSPIWHLLLPDSCVDSPSDFSTRALTHLFRQQTEIDSSLKRHLPAVDT
jgi:hypothetical protein